MRKVTYKATGTVWGNYWGGGQGGYSAHSVVADTREELDQKINKAIKDGSLDSGMGYESLIGAVMFIDTIDDREIDGKIFSNVETEAEVYGDLSDEVVELLLNN